MSEQTLEDVYNYVATEALVSFNTLSALKVIEIHCEEALNFSIPKLDEACELFERSCYGKLSVNTIKTCVSSLRTSVRICIGKKLIPCPEGFSIKAVGKRFTLVTPKTKKIKRVRDRKEKSVTHLQLYQESMLAFLPAYSSFILSTESEDEQQRESEKRKFESMKPRLVHQLGVLENACKLLQDARALGQLVLNERKWDLEGKNLLDLDGLNTSQDLTPPENVNSSGSPKTTCLTTTELRVISEDVTS